MAHIKGKLFTGQVWGAEDDVLYVLGLEQWMCVGLSLFSKVRLVFPMVSLKAVPDWFVLLQLKSVFSIKISHNDGVVIVVSKESKQFC